MVIFTPAGQSSLFFPGSPGRILREGHTLFPGRSDWGGMTVVGWSNIWFDRDISVFDIYIIM